MSRISPLAFGLALPMALMSQAALADLTPAQVWGDWRQYMEGMGYQITATEAENGGTLTVSGLTVMIPAGTGSGAGSMSIGSVEFVQQSDGSVAIVMPAEMPLSIAIEGNGIDNDDVTMDMVYSQSGHSLIASGDPAKMTYAYNAATIAMTLNQLTVADESFGAENARMTFSASDLNSITTMTIGDLRGYDQKGSINNLAYDVFIDNPAESAKVAINGGIASMGFEGGGTIPVGLANTAAISDIIRAGFDISGLMTYATGSTTMNVTDPVNGDFTAQTSSAGGALGVAMSAKGITYDGSQSNLNVAMTVAGLPFPINLSMDQSAFKMALPVTKSDDPQDFAFGLTLANFKMSDMIWGMFDPTGQLPRDPATLELDMTGKATVTMDYMDPDAAMAMVGEAPGQVEDMKINKLLLNVAGATLEGTGDVVFDNADRTTVPGIPKPVGEVNLSLAGGNGLLDKLVNMGLLPQDQAMGARMMMGLFGVPGTAPDTLSSKIEFTPEGGILANGQQIR